MFYQWFLRLDRGAGAGFQAGAPRAEARGYYIFYDVHPFLRPWKDQITPLEMERPYTETGPFEFEGYGHTNYQFHWRISDLINPLLDSGLILRQLAESSAKEARFWEGISYTPGVRSRPAGLAEQPTRRAAGMADGGRAKTQ